MGNLWLKIKVWTKIVVAALIAIYLLIFVLQNGSQKVTFWWWFGHQYEGSMLYLVFFTFLIGGLVAILATTTVRTIRQVKELRNRNRSQKLEREIAEMKTKAAMLQTKPFAGATSPLTSVGGDAAPPEEDSHADEEAPPT